MRLFARPRKLLLKSFGYSLCEYAITNPRFVKLRPAPDDLFPAECHYHVARSSLAKTRMSESRSKQYPGDTSAHPNADGAAFCGDPTAHQSTSLFTSSPSVSFSLFLSPGTRAPVYLHVIIIIIIILCFTSVGFVDTKNKIENRPG